MQLPVYDAYYNFLLLSSRSSCTYIYYMYASFEVLLVRVIRPRTTIHLKVENYHLLQLEWTYNIVDAFPVWKFFFFYYNEFLVQVCTRNYIIIISLILFFFFFNVYLYFFFVFNLKKNIFHAAKFRRTTISFSLIAYKSVKDY